jgi:hypothetical protein
VLAISVSMCTRREYMYDIFLAIYMSERLGPDGYRLRSGKGYCKPR